MLQFFMFWRINTVSIGIIVLTPNRNIISVSNNFPSCHFYKLHRIEISRFVYRYNIEQSLWRVIYAPANCFLIGKSLFGHLLITLE